MDWLEIIYKELPVGLLLGGSQLPGSFITENPRNGFASTLKSLKEEDNVSTCVKLPVGSINACKLLKDPQGPLGCLIKSKNILENNVNTEIIA